MLNNTFIWCILYSKRVNAMKYVFSLLVIFFTALPVHSQSDLKFNFNSGSFGFGVNFPLTKDYSFEGSITLINVGVEDQYRNIGIEFSPLKIYLWTGGSDNNYENSDIVGLSLVNLNSYWNIIPGKIFLGPFASVNYFFIDEKLHFDRYVFTLGMQFGLRFDFQKFNYNFITAEIGYKNINGNHRYHLGFKMDILSFLLSSILL